MEDACPATIDDDFGPESNSLRCISSGEANAEVQQYTQINMDDIVDVQGGHHCFSANTEDSLMDGKVGELVDSGIHHLQDSHVQFYGLDEISVEVEGANSGESSTNSGESSIIQESRLPVSYEAKMEKCLSKSATFPSSGLEFSHSFCVEENVHSPSTTSSSQDVSLDQLSPYKRSVSLPAPVKLVSAMKGGRAQNGTTLKLDLNVKWASDVYDPPGSSMSPIMPRTDNGLPKSKKKDKHKHKHAKGKSVRGGSNEKKHGKRRVGGMP